MISHSLLTRAPISHNMWQRSSGRALEYIWQVELYMRVVSLNYLGFYQWPLIVICVIARARVVICCTRRSRGTPQEKPDDDWCQEKEGRKKVGIFMHMCSPRCDDLFSLGHSF